LEKDRRLLKYAAESVDRDTGSRKKTGTEEPIGWLPIAPFKPRVAAHRNDSEKGRKFCGQSRPRNTREKVGSERGNIVKVPPRIATNRFQGEKNRGRNPMKRTKVYPGKSRVQKDVPEE